MTRASSKLIQLYIRRKPKILSSLKVRKEAMKLILMIEKLQLSVNGVKREQYVTKKRK